MDNVSFFSRLFFFLSFFLFSDALFLLQLRIYYIIISKYDIKL